jgi:multiple sugar transport system substrate-binding protein
MRHSIRAVVVKTTSALLVLTLACSGAGPASGPAPAAEAAAARRDVVDDLQHRTFQWFWDTANAQNGLVPDRWPAESFSSIAAVGFGLTAYGIGAERGWVSREDAAQRVLTTLRFFENGVDGERGFYYHFVDMKTGKRFKDVELSTIDTTLFLAGALFCQSYFDRDTEAERAIRETAERLYTRAEWNTFLARPPLISMGWTPEHGLHDYDYTGYNEAMILYILAIGSPTHPVSPKAWNLYTSTYKWEDEHLVFPPLFGHQYSHVWIDFRGIQDHYMRGKGIDYFENSRRATDAQQKYAIANPMGWKGYGENVWGLTACDGPFDGMLTIKGTAKQFWTYAARGTSPHETRDDGPHRQRRGLVRPRPPRHRPGPHRGHDREPPLRPRLEHDAEERARAARPQARGVHGGMAGAVNVSQRKEEGGKRKEASRRRVTRAALLSFLLPLSSFLLLHSCARPQSATTIEFWGLGREGEVVAEFIPEFEKETGIHVDAQQIPWTAAHEKILTAHVGGSLPDALQVGNSWMSELVTVGALVPLDERLVPRGDYFSGIWDTNVIGGTLYGIPWYVDTRLLFYRTDMIPVPPRTWSEWIAVMARLRREHPSRDFYPIVMPTNEWPQPVILALQSGAVLVDDSAHARFDDARFTEAFSFYVDMFRRGYAPAVSNTQVANIYQQFGEGHFAMWITGPWDVGNLRTRLTAEQQKTWSTAPLPAPDGTPYPGVSVAGGATLVISKTSRKQEAAKQFIAFLSRPAIQARFYEITGDLPARKSAWRTPELVADRELAAFGKQLERTVALPRLPEAENIMNAVAEHGQLAVREQYTAQQAALALDRKIDAMLEKRRWVLRKFAQVHPRSRVFARDKLSEGTEARQ